MNTRSNLLILHKNGKLLSFYLSISREKNSSLNRPYNQTLKFSFAAKFNSFSSTRKHGRKDHLDFDRGSKVGKLTLLGT